MHKPTMMPFLFAAMSAMLLLGGCFRYQPMSGNPGPAEPLGEGAWVVSEDTSGVERLLETPSELALWEFDREVLQKQNPEITDEDIALAEEGVKITISKAEIRNGGIVRFWGDRASGVSWKRSLTRGPFSIQLEDFKTGGTYLSADQYTALQAREDSRGGIDFAMQFIEMQLRHKGIQRTNAERDWRLRDGIRIGLPEANALGDGERKPDGWLGTIVHIASFYENEYEHRVLDRLKGYGWAVGHIGSDISIDGPNALAQLEQRMKRQAYRRELIEQDEEYQQVQKAIADRNPTVEEMNLHFKRLQAIGKESAERYPILDSGLEVYPDTDLEAHARMLAGIVDCRIAEHAYAAQALIEESDRLEPSLADKPIVVMGFSAGALVAPAVAARLRGLYPDRDIALVMIGGGGDVLSSSIESVFTDGKIDLEPRDGPEPTAAQLDALVTHYRAASKLDPLSLAPVVRDLPTLHVYAKRDTVVPTSSARAFNEAHGHVDRLVHPFNHDTLFYFVPGEVGRIRSWLRAHGLED